MRADTDENGLPYVSVIVPVYNDARHLQLCLDALRKQTYPRDRYETIVVDNNSTDESRSIAEAANVVTLAEREVQSSYAARNTGLRAARGSILAYCDSDCVPRPDWIAAGVDVLESGADLAGGRVEFTFSTAPSGAELFDSISNMQVEDNVRDRGVAKTANLFVKKTVFDDVGQFPAEVKSGGDVMWTGRASAAGHRLVYAESAVVCHPARRLRALASKQFRVGTGQPKLRDRDASHVLTPVRSALGALRRTESVHYLRQRLHAKGLDHNVTTLVRVWAAALSVRLAMAAGNLATLLPKAR